jgi:TolA-binding protein
MREAQPPPPRIDPPKPVIRPADVAPKPAPPLADADESAPTELAAAAIPPGGKRTPELALQEGHAALARRDYTLAERSAREVMANRTSPRAYDGQFLLAQALTGEKQFAQAAIAYDDTYNRSHKGRHAQDALLGLAGALTAINEKKAACDTLGRLRTEFPQVRADLQDTITRTNDHAGCGR